jgi:hypothetical protein
MSPLRPAGWRGLVSAVILSAATISVAACGGSGDDNAGAANRQVNSQTSSQSGTQSSSTNQTGSSTQSGGGSMSQSSFSTDEGTVRLYAGSSDATITVDVDSDSRLLWSNDKGRSFRLTGAGDSIDSTDGSGEVPLSGGQHRLQVHGAVWTIVIRPG